jgi:hypothetical protein
MMSVEQPVEWMAGETRVLEEDLSQCYFIHHEATWPEPGSNLATAAESQILSTWDTARPIKSVNYEYVCPNYLSRLCEYWKEVKSYETFSIACPVLPISMPE